MAKTKDQRWDEIYQQARKEFEKASNASEEQREASLEDRRFYSVAGAQWDGSFGDAFKNKTKLELNKVNLAVYRIINEWRGNRITVDFIPKNGVQDDDLSDLCNGLFRSDEQDSQSKEAYDTAFEEQCSGGFGAWRITTKYENEYDPEDEEQRICVEPIHDADQRVYFDSNAKLYDKSDARHCFVLEPYSRQAYEDEFGDDPVSWEPPIETQFSWFDGDDSVYVAEYFRVEEKSRVREVWRSIDGTEESYWQDEIADDDINKMLAVGTIKVRVKKVLDRKIRKYLMSGGGILEDCGYIAGKCIPIVPCYGKRSVVNKVERWAGAVRYAKDAQRLYNMQISYLADIAARGGYRKPIVAPEQVQGLENYWASDAEENYAYLPLNPITNPDGSQTYQGPLDYTNPPETPPTMAALIQIVGEDMMNILGNQEAGEESDVQLSGKAIELIQTRLDQQAVIYMSNFSLSVQRAGAIWLSIASELYSEQGRTMKTVTAQGKIGSAILNDSSTIDSATGKIIRKNDISRAKMNIQTDVGPTSSSKRSATVRAISGLIPVVADQQDKKVLASLVMMNMEGEGISNVREYYRKQLVNMGVIEPTEEEIAKNAQTAENAQPSAEEQFLLSEAAESQANAQKAEAQTVESLARAEKAKADAAKTLAAIENSQRDSVVSAVDKLSKAGTAPLQNGVSNRGENFNER